jgi:hypothetical protein
MSKSVNSVQQQEMSNEKGRKSNLAPGKLSIRIHFYPTRLVKLVKPETLRTMACN